MDQELHRGLLVMLLLKSVWNHSGNGPGAPQRTFAYSPYEKCIESVRKWIIQRTSAYISYEKCMESVGKWSRSFTEDFCLYSLLKVYGISKPQRTSACMPY
jgi:hypothetical protein